MCLLRPCTSSLLHAEDWHASLLISFNPLASPKLFSSSVLENSNGLLLFGPYYVSLVFFSRTNPHVTQMASSQLVLDFLEDFKGWWYSSLQPMTPKPFSARLEARTVQPVANILYKMQKVMRPIISDFGTIACSAEWLHGVRRSRNSMALSSGE